MLLFSCRDARRHAYGADVKIFPMHNYRRAKPTCPFPAVSREAVSGFFGRVEAEWGVVFR
ncbi:MAG: hypothetical protein MI923_05155 [Phycisphaerales bacterium]|nr:hypothetical protein [Phycisphaerales bacterium]